MKINQVLVESAQVSVAFAFGRFNPAHQGHIEVWRTVEQAGKNWFIGTNPSTLGPNDPLTFQQKSAWMQEIYPPIQGHIVPEQSVLTLAAYIFKKLRKNESATIAYITDDTDWAWSGKLLNQYNGVEGSHGYYTFAEIVHVPSPRVSSATALRDAARADDKVAFYQASGTDPKLKVAGLTYFDTVKEAVAKYPLPVKKAKQGVAEVSKATLDRYVPKAVDAHGHADFSARMSKDDPTLRSYHVDQKKTAEKRRQGISRALDRMSKMEDVAEEKQRLDPKCWDGYKKQGTKMKGGVRVNKCVKESALDEKSVSQAQFRTMAAVANNPEFAKKVGINPAVGKEFHSADKKTNYKKLPKNAATESLDADQKRAGQVGSKDKAKQIGQVLANPTKQHPYKGRLVGEADGFNGEYDDEAGMAKSNLLTTARAVAGLLKTIQDNDNLPEWGQEKIAKAEMMLVSIWDYLQSQKEQGIDPKVEGVTEDEMDFGPEWDEIVKRVGQRAKQGPLKTVWDEKKRVYRNVPVNDPDQPSKEVDEASLATMRDYFAGDIDAKDPTKLAQMRDFFDKNKPVQGKVQDKRFASKQAYEFWLKKNGLRDLSSK